MRRHRAFTFKDMLVVVVASALALIILGVLWPARSRDRISHRQAENMTQMRGIHAGMILFAQGNNGHYTGIMPDGKTINPNVGLTAQGRVQQLIEGNYLSLEYARSRSEVQTGTTSYALLKIDAGSDGKSILQSARNSEWHDTMNDKAVVVSDRAILVTGTKGRYHSIHQTLGQDDSNWRGSVTWNDNHVTFESTTLFATRYNETAHAADDLFDTPSDSIQGDDAFMVWHDSMSL